MTFISYAQNFEDVMLWRALKHVNAGFYIDVGAWSPDIDSVTRAFYENGWRGINVEPNPEFNEQLRSRRPRDMNLKVAIGDSENSLVMNFLTNPGLSTLDDSIAERHQAAGWSVNRQEVQIRALSAIWSDYVPDQQEVHFLKVDVEGFEEPALRGNDWSKYRPWVVVVEATLPMSQDESHQTWEPILLAAGYHFAYADGLNRFYVAQEHIDLLPAFKYPPNVFDGFKLQTQQQAETRCARAVLTVEQAEAKAQEAEAKAQEAEAKAQEAKTQLTSIYNSRSWRITAPLRNTSALLQNSLKNHGRQHSLIRSLVQFCADSQLVRALALPALRRLPKVRQKLVAIYTNQGQHDPALPENRGELRTILPRRTSSVRKECIKSDYTSSISYTDTWPIPQLIIDGHFNGSYSLASVNRHIVNRLLDSSFESLIGISPREGNPRTRVDAVPSGKAELDRLNSLVHQNTIRDTTNKNLVWLYHHYPLVKETQDKGTSIALFFWEESLVPEEMIETLNSNYHGVITTSWFVKKALIDSGCQIPIETISLPLVRNPHAKECRAEDILNKNRQKNIRLLHVSSCFPRKGADILLKAFSTLAAKYEDIELVIKSFHNPHNTVESLIEQIVPRHLHSRLQLILDEYNTEQMAELYRSADIVVLPTRGEGLNMPAIEAGEFSRLLVTTAYGAQTDYIKAETASLIDFRFDYAKTHLSHTDSVWVEPSLASLEREVASLIEDIQRADDTITRRAQSLNKDIEEIFFSPNSVRSLLSALSRIQILSHSSFTSSQLLSISIVTTWGEACGIAEYSRYLAGCFSERGIPIEIISAHTSEDPAPSDTNNTFRVTKRWVKGASVDQDLMHSEGNILWLQHHFAFYPLNDDLALRISSLRSNGKSVFITMHTTAPALNFNPKQLAACAECLNQFDRIFVHTLADLNNLMQIGITDNVTLMPQGVSPLKTRKQKTPEFHTKNNGVTLIGSFGFLFPHKGIFELIKAFHLYINEPKTPKDAKLRLVTAVRNDGYSREEHERCQELAKKLGIESRIEWFADFLPIERTQELLSECDVIVLAYQTTQESSSAAVRMAVACCDRVACTPLPIFDEVRDVTFEINGFGANDITKTLLRLRDDLSGDIRLRREEWLENHGWDRVASRYIGIFKGIRNNSKA